MENNWTEYWDTRYAADEFAFGTEPNDYLKEQLVKLHPGSILFAAEGEGRNAVFAAKEGWNVSAFDISLQGRNKALLLARSNGVEIDYQVGELPTLSFSSDQFDVIALIYAHFPAAIKSEYHRLLDRYLRVGGIVVFEAFSKRHLEYRLKNEKVGGPRDLESLFSIEEIKSDFENYRIIELEEMEIELSEGSFHNGRGSVIRYVGQKYKSH